MELREQIAREFFDIEKEEKESTIERWDEVQWESLSEKHRDEYYKTVKRIYGYIRSEIERVENPVSDDPYDDWGNGFESCRRDILKLLEG